jgi:uncharacterized DUF497 family protein
MRIRYTLQGIHFEWDSQKAADNLKKHGVAFETACQTFFDPFVVAGPEEVVEGELRESLLGMTLDWQLLYVVYTLRAGEIFRLISARPTTSTERTHYEEP